MSIFLAMGALLVSAVNSKTADARPSYSNLHAYKAPAVAAPLPATATTTIAAPETTETSPVVATSLAAPAERVSPPRLLEDRGLRRLKKAETSPAMLQEAARLVRKYHAKPVGTEITVDVEGKLVTARIERHFHPEGGPVKPWGFHPGVSLFIAR